MHEYRVTVKPGSKKGPLIETTGDGFIVYVRARAVEGKANEAVIVLLANHLHVAKSAIKIIRGHTSRHKTLLVH